MYNKKGFSLVSFLLYLMLFTMITLFSCHIIVSLIIPSFAATRKCRSIIALHSALDLFVNDIHAINNNSVIWKLITSQELMWQNNERTISWRFNNNRLERKEGTYNQGWKDATTSIIGTGIKNATFILKRYREEIIGIKLHILPIISTKPITCYVVIKKEKK